MLPPVGSHSDPLNDAPDIPECPLSQSLPFPRKRRTREHVIADQSVNHLERFIYGAGFTAERVRHDYGYDLTMATYDADGHVEPAQVMFQVKSSDRLRQTAAGTHFTFDISVEDLNCWLSEPMPVFLVLYDAAARCAYWLYLQRYFQERPSRKPRPGAVTVRVTVPKANRVSRRWIAFARRCKENVLRQQ